jgi:hypothetical protein
VPIHRQRRTYPSVLTLLAISLTAGCMVVPKTTSTYNADCRMVQKHITLEAQQVGAVANCRNNAECTGLLAFYGVVAAASAVVSGSVAVVGNVAYWLEKQGQCNRQGANQPEPKPASASPQVRALTVRSEA